MDFSEYQEEAGKTAIYPQRGNNLAYPVMGLAGEAGEVANKAKKVYRDSGGKLTDEARLAISHELGDVLWYVAACCSEIGYSMSFVAQRNLDKLAARQATGKLKGDGDKR